MKIRSQIILAQVPTAVIILFITGFFIFSLTVIEYKAESILFNNFKSILSMQKLDDNAEELNIYSIYHPNVFDEHIKKLESKIEQELIFQEKLMIDSGEEKELVQSLRKKWESYKASLHSLPPGTSAAKPYNELKQLTASIIGLNQDAIIRNKDALSKFIAENRFFISTSSLISLIFVFFMSWIFTGLFLSPLNKMTEIVSQFGKTDETTLLHIKGAEEIEKLSSEFNLMTSRLEEYHQSSLGHVYENYENLKGAFDGLPDPLLLFDHYYDIIFMNASASQLFGISGSIKKKNPLLYLENTLRESLIKIVKKAFLTKKTHVAETSEEPIAIFNKKKKILFIPLVYPIKSAENMNHSKLTGVLIVLQDPTRQSLSEQETGKICRTFIDDFQEPLGEIQMALFASVEEKAGSLTEKQKEILQVARDKCDELEKLYRDFRKITELTKKKG